MTTKEVLEVIFQNSDSDLSIVSSLGRTAGDVFNYYPKQTLFLDSMGDVCSTSIGVALGIGKKHPILAIDTDGSHLMGVTILSTIASLKVKLPNLCIIVLDNHIYESGGGLQTTDVIPDWEKIGSGWGIEIKVIDNIEELKIVKKSFFKGFQYIILKVLNPKTDSEQSKKTIDGIESKYLFVRHLEKILNAKILAPCTKN